MCVKKMDTSNIILTIPKNTTPLFFYKQSLLFFIHVFNLYFFYKNNVLQMYNGSIMVCT